MVHFKLYRKVALTGILAIFLVSCGGGTIGGERSGSSDSLLFDGWNSYKNGVFEKLYGNEVKSYNLSTLYGLNTSNGKIESLKNAEMGQTKSGNAFVFSPIELSSAKNLATNKKTFRRMKYFYKSGDSFLPILSKKSDVVKYVYTKNGVQQPGIEVSSLEKRYLKYRSSPSDNRYKIYGKSSSESTILLKGEALVYIL